MREGSGEFASEGGSGKQMPEKGDGGAGSQTPKEIIEKTLGDAPASGEVSYALDTEQLQERRVAVNKLAVDLLHLCNPQQSKESLSERFHARTDIYTKPFDQAYREARSERSITALEDAVGIVRFYMDNPYLVVPTKIVKITDSVKNPELSDDPEEKVLVYLEQPLSKIYGKKGDAKTYQFADTRKVGLMRTTTPQELPDVFIKDLNMHNPSFTLQGPENVLIGDSILSYSQHDHNTSVSIQAQGKIALLPEIYVTGGGYPNSPSRKISLHALGDIVQYPNTKLAAQEISCLDFIQKGGNIVAPTPDVSEINCTGSFIYEDGAVEEEPGVKIRDKHFYDSGGVSSIQERIIRSEAGIIAHEEVPIKEIASPETPQEHEEVQPFEEKYAYKKEGTRLDGTVIRAYNLGFIEPDEYVEFAFGAEMEGWNISSAQSVNGEMCVTLRKVPTNE